MRCLSLLLSLLDMIGTNLTLLTPTLFANILGWSLARGSFVAWTIARRYPSRVLGVASAVLPFFHHTPTFVSAAEHVSQGRLEWYYQVYCSKDNGARAAREFDSDVAHTLSCFIRSSEKSDRVKLGMSGFPYVCSFLS